MLATPLQYTTHFLRPASTLSTCYVIQAHLPCCLTYQVSLTKTGELAISLNVEIAVVYCLAPALMGRQKGYPFGILCQPYLKSDAPRDETLVLLNALCDNWQLIS